MVALLAVVVGDAPEGQVVADAPNCRDCLHYRETTIFELCMRANATYSVAGKVDQHTVGHMRRWECGADGRLFEPRKVA